MGTDSPEPFADQTAENSFQQLQFVPLASFFFIRHRILVFLAIKKYLNAAEFEARCLILYVIWERWEEGLQALHPKRIGCRNREMKEVT